MAIARALVNEPNVLLLDEPLGALDLKLRKEMQRELKRIQQEVGITFIYVTHDQEEALTMSDKIVVMNAGEIEQIGTPLEIYNEPVNAYVARFIGESNIVTGTMVKDYLVRFDEKEFECRDFGFRTEEPVDVLIRPEDLKVVKPEDGIMRGEVKSVVFKGVHYELMVETRTGTSKTVQMHVVTQHDRENPVNGEKISANDFYVDLEDLQNGALTDQDFISIANAQAWDEENRDISLTHVSHNIANAPGEYTITFGTDKHTEVSVKVYVIHLDMSRTRHDGRGSRAEYRKIVRPGNAHILDYKIVVLQIDICAGAVRIHTLIGPHANRGVGLEIDGVVEAVVVMCGAIAAAERANSVVTMA